MTKDTSLDITNHDSMSTCCMDNSQHESIEEVVTVPLEEITTGFYLEESHLRPDGVFTKGYRELQPYEKTAFAGISLKKTKNGQRAKSGIQLERSISPKRR